MKIGLEGSGVAFVDSGEEEGVARLSPGEGGGGGL